MQCRATYKATGKESEDKGLMRFMLNTRRTKSESI